jgi:predicted ATPase
VQIVDSRLAGRPVTPRTNLPAALSSFIGREDDAAEVSRLLSTVRLLTLTGAGGVGKTRLALHVAAQLTTVYPEGVWLVDLAPLAEPMLVPQAVASVLGVREQPGIALAETLAAALRETQLLLVLDNCEHLIEACAALVHRLLEACSCLRVLTTSREALGVPGETAWQVLPLPVPSSPTQATFDGLQANWAVRLFVERARSVAPDFDLSPLNAVTIGDVCDRLDGLPFAIELAAARVKVLAPAQIAARLDDRLNLLVAGSRTAPSRQRTLRATLDWSYDLLTASEQLLFARLAVFSGGWTLESAEAVGGTEGITAAEVLGLLAALVAKSLVLTEAGVTGTVRYRFLETVRQYALDRLADRRDAELVRNWHATYPHRRRGRCVASVRTP